MGEKLVEMKGKPLTEEWIELARHLAAPADVPGIAESGDERKRLLKTTLWRGVRRT